jgi:hypothetical protein
VGRSQQSYPVRDRVGRTRLRHGDPDPRGDGRDRGIEPALHRERCAGHDRPGAAPRDRRDPRERRHHLHPAGGHAGDGALCRSAVLRGVRAAGGAQSRHGGDRPIDATGTSGEHYGPAGRRAGAGAGGHGAGVARHLRQARCRARCRRREPRGTAQGARFAGAAAADRAGGRPRDQGAGFPARPQPHRPLSERAGRDEEGHQGAHQDAVARSRLHHRPREFPGGQGELPARRDPRPHQYRAERHHQDLHRRGRRFPAADPDRQHLRHELRLHAGAALALRISRRHRPDDPVGGAPMWYFRRRGWL